MKSLMIAITSIFLLFQVISYSQPTIEIDGNNDTYDWGKINPKGAPLTAKIKIYNKGTESLNISEVKPGCGCTTAPLDKNNIEPNGFATLSVTLNVSNDGPVHKSITIKSNDPKAQTKILSLKADIVRSIGLSPRYLFFNNMEIGKESTSKIIMKNNTNRIIEITDVIIIPEDLHINLKKDTQVLANKELTFVARYTPNDSTNVSGKITIKTNDKDLETIELSVWGNVIQTKSK